jgi:hypothetical protein
VLSNHFHLLIEVPSRPSKEHLPDDSGLISHVEACLGRRRADALAWELGQLRGMGAHEAAEAVRERWFARMWDVSCYLQILKHRYSKWHNARHRRKGTLWEERFRSVLVEGKGPALRAMAAYIDLNPVRAGLCEDPKDYRWCGYAEAVAGGRLARAALRALQAMREHAPVLEKVEGRSAESNENVLAAWRRFLFGVPEGAEAREEQAVRGAAAQLFRRRISRAKCLQVLRQGGKLATADYLRCRVRYFTDGLMLGSKPFIEEMFGALRQHFPPTRKDCARRMHGLAPPQDGLSAGLCTARALQTALFG